MTQLSKVHKREQPAIPIGGSHVPPPYIQHCTPDTHLLYTASGSRSLGCKGKGTLCVDRPFNAHTTLSGYQGRQSVNASTDGTIGTGRATIGTGRATTSTMTLSTTIRPW